MAFNFKEPYEFERKLQRLTNVEFYAPKMLNAAAPLVVEAIRKRTPVRSGNLKNSVAYSKPTISKRGSWMCNVYFNGYEKRRFKNGTQLKIPNIEKARSIEFGRSVIGFSKAKNKSYGEIKASPFIYPALKDCQEDVVKAMQDTFEKET